MNALWLENQQLRYRTDAPDPLPFGREALIQVRLAGICATDLELVRGYYPFTGVLGHEFVGQVLEAPETGWVGKRVVGEINAACGECSMCRSARPTHCERRTVLGIVNRSGAFAQRLILPLENLHRVPDAIPDDAAVFTEPLAAALQITQQIHLRPTDHVLLLGAGRLGQLIAQVLALTGCQLWAAARHETQIRLLKALGIPVLHPEQVSSASMDIVIEATGSPEGFALARCAVRPHGTIVLKSTYHGQLTTDFSSLVVDEITLVGSRCGPFAPALRLLESGRVDVTPLTAALYPLRQAPEAFDHAARPGTLKILVKP
jgi:threonine dehydrogenase-like Zn-dependent dehydrogenase